MSIPLLEVLQLLLAGLVAGALDAVVGFGGGLLLLPVMVLLYGPVDGVIVTAAVSLVWALSRFIILRSSVDTRSLRLLLLGGIPGAVSGSVLLTELDPVMVETFIGILLVVLGSYYVTRLYTDLPDVPIGGTWGMISAGFVAAAITGALGAGNGPIQSVAMTSAGVVPLGISATNSLIGTVINGVKLLTYSASGAVLSFPVIETVVAGAGAIGGTFAGIGISKRTRDSTIRLLVGVVIIIAGVRILLS